MSGSTAPASVGWPHPTDFAAPPTRADLARWDEADRAARPARLARLRARMAEAGVDGYFGVRWEHMRYLTGLPFDEREVAGAGDSGKFLVTASELIVLADSRYTIAVRRDAPESRLFECYNALVARWPELLRERRRPARGHRGDDDPAPDLGAPPGRGPGRRARGHRGLGRGGPAGQGAGRDRARRGRLRRRRPRPRVAPAFHSSGRHRGRAGARSRMADAHRWRRAARLRRHLPRRSRGRPAARVARRPARSAGAPCSSSTSGPRSAATGAT